MERPMTRSIAKNINQEIVDTGLTSGVQLEASSSTFQQPRIDETCMIPQVGRRIIDHSHRTEETSTVPAAMEGHAIASGTRALAEARSLDVSDQRSQTSRLSRARINALRQRREYEAELKLAEMQEALIRKKLAVEMAELDAEEEDLEVRAESAQTTERVEEWLHDTPGPIPLTGAPRVTVSASNPVADQGAAVTERCEPLPEYRRDQCSAMGELAEAIRDLGKSRPIPRQLYELPIFNGNPVDWLAYKEAYSSTSCALQLKPYENMTRLRLSLQGDAKTAVEDLLRSSSDPEDIMTALEEEFGNPRLLLECALSKVRSLPRVTDNSRDICKFAAIVRNAVSLLKNIKADGYINNPQLVSELLAKLTPIQRAQYGEYAMKMDRESNTDLRVSPNLGMFVNFLNYLGKTAAYYTPVSICSTSFAVSTTISRDKNKTATSKGLSHKLFTAVTDSNSDDNTRNSKDLCCVLCKQNHTLPQCNDFKQMDVNMRWNVVKDNKLCFRCISKRHPRQYCRDKSRCGSCDARHHTLLHADKEKPATVSGFLQKKTEPADIEAVSNLGECRPKALLKIIPVSIIINDTFQDTCALLDDGATVSLLDESLARGASGVNAPLRIISARGKIIEDKESRRVHFEIRGPNGVVHNISARTMRNINLPAQTVTNEIIHSNSHLLDLNFRELRDAKPMLLLGQDNWELIVNQELRRGRSGQPVASLTRLGWVVHGPVSQNIKTFSVSTVSESVHCSVDRLADLHTLVKEQFDLEAIGIREVSRQNEESTRATKILDETSRRIEGGWEVGLLWRQDEVQFPDNKKQVQQRLYGVERKMGRDSTYAAAYTQQIDRLLAEGYAKKFEPGMYSGPTWYLPHFGVLNPNKPGKLRLVFDAAAKYSGVSLNDLLMSGPNLMNALLGVLMRFRIGRIAFTADIADMFLRVKIRKEDRGAQLFLWRGQDRTRDPETYIMDSMIFGAASSPTTATYIINRNAGEFMSEYPEAVQAIKNNHYVDDYLHSVETVDLAMKLVNDVTKVHAAGGFHIRGWATNSTELRERLRSAEVNKVTVDKSSNCSERTLGMIWKPDEDAWAYDLSFKKIAPDLISGERIPTKREYLSCIMSIFDPLGFLYPYVIQSRILMQRIWRTGISWDEKLHQTDAEEWRRWITLLLELTELRVPRWYGVNSTSGIELHVFGDASELAYAAVAYIVGYDEVSNRRVVLVAAKARVASVKVVSIPRLELQAAVLACRLACMIENELGITISSKCLWTDSRTVLRWIRSDPRDYQKFVSHRLAEIDSKSNVSDWRWVPSADNPADEATKLFNRNKSFWFSGPSFLWGSQEQWPMEEQQRCSHIEDDPERIQHVHTKVERTIDALIDVTAYSSWNRARRVLGRVFAFVNRCRKKQDQSLTVENIWAAEICLLRHAQERSYPDELNALREGRVLPADSRLAQLDPMLYDGLIRVVSIRTARGTLVRPVVKVAVLPING